MNPAQLDAIVQRYLRATFDDIEETLSLQWTDAGRDVQCTALAERHDRLNLAPEDGDYGPALELARALAPGADDDAIRKLARRLVEVQMEAVRAEIRAHRGHPLRFDGMQPPAAAVEQDAPKVSLRVSEAAKLYGDERVGEGKWSAKTELQSRTILALLSDLLGDPSIGDVNKAAIRQLGLEIAALPSNMTKRFPGVAAREVLSRLEGDTSTPRLEPRSVNKYRQLARSLFRWAYNNEHAPSNPATVLGDVKERRARDDRKPFTDDDLRAYFAHLPTSAGATPYLYWIPRMLAYSGMRLHSASTRT